MLVQTFLEIGPIVTERTLVGQLLLVNAGYVILQDVTLGESPTTMLALESSGRLVHGGNV